MDINKKHKALILSFFVLFPVVVFSATATNTFNVSATISSSCSVNANSLSFGTYNPILGTALTATTSLNVTCTYNTTYNVGLDPGQGTSATVSNRLMTRTSGGTNTIAYSLYQDSGYATVWGNTVGTNTVAGTGTGNAQTLTVYGKIFPSPQNATTLPPANYSDLITITVTY